MEVSALKEILISQHLASLDMMEKIIKEISGELWLSSAYVNPTWQVAYHALFFFRLYLFDRLEDHAHWSGHRKGAQHMPQDSDALPVEPVSQSDMLLFVQACRNEIRPRILATDILREECGFSWYEVGKAEHLMVNVRHLQHHVAQLQDRLRNAEGKGIRWTKKG